MNVLMSKHSFLRDRFHLIYIICSLLYSDKLVPIKCDHLHPIEAFPIRQEEERWQCDLKFVSDAKLCYGGLPVRL